MRVALVLAQSVRYAGQTEAGSRLDGRVCGRYGAFMAANLLAHAGNLFACGIARRCAAPRPLRTE